MKHILSFLLLFTVALSFAQTEGVVTYKEEIKNEKAAEIREKMKARGFQVDIPDVMESKQNLYFNSSESVYKPIPKKEEKYEGRQIGSKSIKVSFSGPGGKGSFYRDIKNGTITKENNFMGKPFLINDNAKKYVWKVTGKTEQIGRYQVMEATTTIQSEDSEQRVQAWFTPQIPVASGPAEFSQLPGLILRVDINDGKRIIYATEIDLRPLTEEEEITKPTKGKKVTQAEYKTIVKEKTEEMKKMYGKEKGVRIIER